MGKKRVAVIGCGAISQTHITAIKTEDISNMAEITAICDIRDDRLEKACVSVPGAAKYNDYKELLEKEELDVVHICTPHYLHAEMAIASLEKGCDVYLEKPCAMNLTQANEIISASDKYGKKVCVSFQNRLINTTLAAREIIGNGNMGKLSGGKGLVTWHREGKYYSSSGWRGKFATEGGGTLMNQSIHTLDLLYYFLGKPSKVKGHTSLNKNFDVTEVEDTAEAFITFENGTSAIFYATNCNVTDSAVEIELYFEKGSLLFRDDCLYKKAGKELVRVCQNEDILSGKGYWGNGHVRMIKSFYNAIDGKDDYYCDIRDSVQVLGIIAEIYKNSEIRPNFL